MIYIPPTPSTDKTQKKWNVLYYFAGNNAISEDMLKKIKRLESVDSDENLNILAKLGRPSDAQYLPGGYRFQIEKQSESQIERNGTSPYEN